MSTTPRRGRTPRDPNRLSCPTRRLRPAQRQGRPPRRYRRPARYVPTSAVPPDPPVLRGRGIAVVVPGVGLGGVPSSGRA
jgi:hypothetical protein